MNPAEPERRTGVSRGKPGYRYETETAFLKPKGPSFYTAHAAKILFIFFSAGLEQPTPLRHDLSEAGRTVPLTH